MKRLLPAIALLAFALGVFSISKYPTDEIANNSYMSESALQPAVATPTFPEASYEEALLMTKEYIRHIEAHTPTLGISLSKWIANWLEDKLRSIRLESVYLHRFHAYQGAELKEGVNVVGILQSRTGGREAMVLNVPSLHHKFFTQEGKSMKRPVSSVCLAISLMKHLRGVQWLSKDVILVISDATFGGDSIAEWLYVYHNYMVQEPILYPFRGPPGALYWHNASYAFHQTFSQVDFVRSGQIRGALVLDFYEESTHYIVVSPEGVNGKLPNLDLLNTLDRVAIFSESVHTTLYNEEDPLVKTFFGSQSYFEDLSLQHCQLYAFILRGAMGEPTGNHGFFLQYNIDAITLRLRSQPIPGSASKEAHMLSVARTIEGTVRSLSNLIEHFHQSFYYYLLSSTFRYISIGQYMISFGMILGSVSIFLGALCIGEPVEEFAYRAVPRTILFHLAGVALFYAVQSTPAFPGDFWVLCVSTATVALVVVRLVDRRLAGFIYGAAEPQWTQEQREVKAKVVTLVSWLPVLMFLSSFSLLNFPFCLLASMVMGAITLVFRPTHRSKMRDFVSALGMCALFLPSVRWLLYLYSPVDMFGYAIYLYLRYSVLIFPFLCLIYFPYTLSLFSLALWDL